jgi:amidophosphoribosyltransferase
MCGVLGIFGSIKLGQGKILLQMLTHRGQDASGLAWLKEPESKIIVSKSNTYPDLLSVDEETEVFLLIGSTRYPTFGSRINESNVEKYAQPFVYKTKEGPIALVHNGNITNIPHLSEKKYESDAEFIVEFLGQMINKNKGDLKNAVQEFMTQVDGSYSIVGIYKNQIFAFRDPKGIRPLVVSNEKEVSVFASESVVLQNIGISNFEDVKPGELIIFSQTKNDSFLLVEKDHAHCMFEYVYFANPCSYIEKQLVYDTRLNLGRELGYRIHQDNMDIDFIVPVPDTSRPASQGLSEILQIPVREAIIKNRYLHRTFIMKSEKERSRIAKRKYLYISNFIKGKNILVVDDSIVRGLTSQKIVRDLRKYGANKIYFAVTCPAIRFACYYGIDFPTDNELIASGNTVKDIEEILDVDKLYYQNIESLKKSIGSVNLCTACLSGSYPTSFAEEIRIKYLNGELSGRSHYEEVS